jgi:cbb3-type cytochrome oxidase subunit 3
MRSEALKFFTDTDMVLLALFLFLTCFVGVIFWIYRKSSKELYQYMGHLPLESLEEEKQS